MSALTFWWKPGCGGNTRQIRQLEQAGCVVTVHDLLSEAWTAERLRPFLQNHPVSKWFNTSAPAIKYGEIETETLDEAAAMALLLSNPLLIRRPLMALENGACTAGFDKAWLSSHNIHLEGPFAGEACPKHVHAAKAAAPDPEVKGAGCREENAHAACGCKDD
jgi:nitrogenase-associated protein